MSPNELPVLTSTEAKKTIAFTDGVPRQVESCEESGVPGVMIYNFSAIRKASLQMTENELLNAPKHIAEYKKTHSDLSDNEIGLLLVAVPEAMFHMTALAFILCHSWKDLCNVTKDKEVFREAVWGWWKDLEEAAWQKLIGISFVKMAAENVANDFTIKEEKDAPKPKN